MNKLHWLRRMRPFVGSVAPTTKPKYFKWLGVIEMMSLYFRYDSALRAPFGPSNQPRSDNVGKRISSLPFNGVYFRPLFVYSLPLSFRHFVRMFFPSASRVLSFVIEKFFTSMFSIPRKSLRAFARRTGSIHFTATMYAKLRVVFSLMARLASFHKCYYAEDIGRLSIHA